MNPNSCDRDLLLQSLRVDLASFIQRALQTVAPGSKYLHNWHIEAICYHLTQCLRGHTKRLVITVPPRHLKSICASVGFPAWALGRDPTLRIINVTYSNELTNDLSRQFRAVVNSDWYPGVFPAVKVAKETEAEFVTTKGGFRFGTSVGGTLTGRGGNFIIIDDPIKPEEAMSKTARESVISWYGTTLTTRLDSKKDDVIILVMQRLHVDDLVGHVLGLDSSGWVQLDLPAIAQESQTIHVGDHSSHRRSIGDLLHPERESQQVLDKLKLSMGSAVFSAQYLQRPIAEEGNLIKRDWFKFYDQPPLREPGDRIVQSWDTAMKPDERNDPSVCTTWHERNGACYLIDVVRQRVDYPDLKRLVLSLRSRFAPDAVLIEDKGSGTALIQELASTGSPFPIAIDPKGDKLMRMHVQAAKVEAGQVYLPRQASWLGEFLFEVLAFPRGRHDDQVDSLSQFLNWVHQPRPIFNYEFIG
jgi:predicted phage terminase large subunit-like protein